MAIAVRGLQCLSDVRPEAVVWLWEPYLPAGMVAMLSGDPGGGKTFIALASQQTYRVHARLIR